MRENKGEEAVWRLSDKQRMCKGTLGAAVSFVTSTLFTQTHPMKTLIKTTQQIFIFSLLTCLSACLDFFILPIMHCVTLKQIREHISCLCFSLVSSGSGLSLHPASGVCLGHWFGFDLHLAFKSGQAWL